MKAQFLVNGKKVTINASKETISAIQGMALKAQLFSQGAKKKHPNEKAAQYYDQWFNGLFDALDEKNYYNRVK